MTKKLHAPSVLSVICAVAVVLLCACGTSSASNSTASTSPTAGAMQYFSVTPDDERFETLYTGLPQDNSGMYIPQHAENSVRDMAKTAYIKYARDKGFDELYGMDIKAHVAGMALTVTQIDEDTLRALGFEPASFEIRDTSLPDGMKRYLTVINYADLEDLFS